MLQNSNSKGSRNFEFSILVVGMAKLRLLISSDLSESVR